MQSIRLCLTETLTGPLALQSFSVGVWFTWNSAVKVKLIFFYKSNKIYFKISVRLHFFMKLLIFFRFWRFSVFSGEIFQNPSHRWVFDRLLPTKKVYKMNDFQHKRFPTKKVSNIKGFQHERFSNKKVSNMKVSYIKGFQHKRFPT